MRKSLLRSGSSNSLTHLLLQVLGIFGLFMAYQQTRLPNIVYTEDLAGFMHIGDPSIMIGVFWFVIPLTFRGFLLGRMAMKKNQSDKMLHFAVFVFVCLVLQVVVEIYLYLCRSNPTAIVETIRRKFIGKFDTIPQDLQKGIQEIQQQAHCCGISSWRDFHKAPSGMPGLGTFLLFTLSIKSLNLRLSMDVTS